MTKRYIVLDTETTGISIEDGHRVIEIGCIEVIDGIKTGYIFHEYINPNREIDKEAIEIHKITNEFLLDKPKFKEIADSFIEFIGPNPNTILVAHNARFDIKFLSHELKLISSDFSLDKFEVIDTVHLSKKKFPGQPANLDALCERLGISNAKRKESGHGALLDADLLTDVFTQLTSEDTSLLADELLFFGFAKQSKKLEPREFTVPEDELPPHLTILKSLDIVWSE